jgi:hypothetical protein
VPVCEVGSITMTIPLIDVFLTVPTRRNNVDWITKQIMVTSRGVAWTHRRELELDGLGIARLIPN